MIYQMNHDVNLTAKVKSQSAAGVSRTEAQQTLQNIHPPKKAVPPFKKRGGLVVHTYVSASTFPVTEVDIEKGELLGLDFTGHVHPITDEESDLIVGLNGDEIRTGPPSKSSWALGDNPQSKHTTIYHGFGGLFYLSTGLILDQSINIGDRLYPSAVPGCLTTHPRTRLDPFAMVVDNLMCTGGYLDSGIPGPVNCPVGGLGIGFVLIKVIWCPNALENN